MLVGVCLSLLAIVLAALLFTAAIETWVAQRGVHPGWAASIIAAVATALPETLVPVVALLAGSQRAVALGALLGAPWMLSTLSLALLGLAAWWQRGRRGVIAVDAHQQAQDLRVFMLGYSYALLASLHPLPGVQGLYALPLLALYGGHVFSTWRRAATHAAMPPPSPPPSLWLTRLRLPLRWALPLQAVLALVLLIVAAHILVQALTALAQAWSLSALLLSLLLVPIATELPEKLNSLLWLRRRQDSLALGNITGALAFQGCLLPAIGLLGLPWRMTPLTLWPALLTWSAGLWLSLLPRPLRAWHLLPPGLLYVGYVAMRGLSA